MDLDLQAGLVLSHRQKKKKYDLILIMYVCINSKLQSGQLETAVPNGSLVFEKGESPIKGTPLDRNSGGNHPLQFLYVYESHVIYRFRLTLK